MGFLRKYDPLPASTFIRVFVKLIGCCLLVYSIYLLWHNIIFTTNVSPYWWRGIAADASVILLAIGVLSLVFLPREFKEIGWVRAGLSIVTVFLSSRAIFNSTGLWDSS